MLIFEKMTIYLHGEVQLQRKSRRQNLANYKRRLRVLTNQPQGRVVQSPIKLTQY